MPNKLNTVSEEIIKQTAVINENGKTKLRVCKAAGAGQQVPLDREYKQRASRYLPTAAQEQSHQNLVFLFRMMSNYSK